MRRKTAESLYECCMAVQLLRRENGLEQISLLKQWPNEVAYSFAGTPMRARTDLEKSSVPLRISLPPQDSVVVL